MTAAGLIAGLAVAAATAALASLVELRAGTGERGVRREHPVGGAALDAVLRLGRRSGAPAPSRDLPRRIAAAGMDPRLSPADAMALKGAAALLVLIVGGPLALGLPGLLGPTAALLAPVAAFYVPDRWLVLRARRRARMMAVEVADVLDLLRVSVAAGQPSGRALVEVGRRHPGLLAVELRRAGREIEAGVRREAVLAALAARCPLPAVTALVAAIGRADLHGAPLAPALAALAADARADRVRLLADHAARAAPKIQLVIALLLVPAVLLLVAAALVGTR